MDSGCRMPLKKNQYETLTGQSGVKPVGQLMTNTALPASNNGKYRLYSNDVLTYFYTIVAILAPILPVEYASYIPLKLEYLLYGEGQHSMNQIYPHKLSPMSFLLVLCFHLGPIFHIN